MGKSHRSMSRPLETVMSILDFDIIAEIKRISAEKDKVSIVDIGSGVGRSLWELSSLFSKEVKDFNLYGIFYNEKPGENCKYPVNAQRYADIIENPLIIAEEFGVKYEGVSMPKMHNTNACKKLPIQEASIDFIYSTNAFHFFDDKIRALEEMSRILKVGGKAVIYIDRSDGGVWGKNTCFPRLRILKDGEYIDVKGYLEAKSNDKFTISVKKTDAFKAGLDFYILYIEKHEKGILDFSELTLDESKSIDINAIRGDDGDFRKTNEYEKLVNSGILFSGNIQKDDFGGHISIYNMSK